MIRAYTPEQVAELGRCQRLKPTRDDCRHLRGYWERPAKVMRPGVGLVDGEVWGVKAKANDNGKITREAAEIGEMIAPFQRADAERYAANQARFDQVAMKDSNGATHFVDAALADATALSNGWGLRWRAGGAKVERGVDGMIFRRGPHGWEPTGRWCLTTPYVRPRKGLNEDGTVKPRGIQHDPDGMPWRFTAGGWSKL